MADKKSSFAVDVTNSYETKAAPTSLVENAGAYEGKAAELEGVKTAEAITHYTKQGKAMYEGWVQSEAAKAATAITDKLNTPEFVGPAAYQAKLDFDTAKEGLALGFAQEQKAGPVEPAVVQEYKEAAARVVAAKESGTMTQGQATAHLAMEMRKLIAAHPAEAAAIRKEFNIYTGRGDWDVRPIETALTAKEKESQAAKDKLQRDEKAAWEFFTKGYAGKAGISTYEEAVRTVAAGDDRAVRMGTMYQADMVTEHANKSMTTGSMNEFFSSAVLSAGAARVKVTASVYEGLKAKGIDLLNMSAVTEAQRPLIMEAYRDMKVAERNALEGSVKMLENKLASNPGMDASIVSDTKEKLNKLLAAPLTTDLDSMLNELKMNGTARNMTADTVLKTHQIRDISLKTTWSDDMLARMKDPRTRANMVKDYPNNPAVKELASVFEGRQVSFSKEMKDMEMIADGLFNEAAPWAHKAAAQQAMSPDAPLQLKQQAAAVVQLQVGKGVEVLTAGVPASPSGAIAAITTATHFNPIGIDGATIYNDVMSGKSEDIFRNDTSKLAEYNKAVLGRTERFLANVDKDSYPVKMKEALDVATARKTGATLVAENGLVVLKNAKLTGNTGADAAIFKLQQQVSEVNKLLSMQTKLSNDTGRAQRFVDEVKTGIAPSKGVIQSVLDNSADNLKPTRSSASQADVRKSEPSPADFPKVSKIEQQSRDSERLRILEMELKADMPAEARAWLEKEIDMERKKQAK